MKSIKIDGEEYIAISSETLFQWWGYLDALENEPILCKLLFYEFLEQCENNLSFSAEFIEEIRDIKREKATPVSDLNELFYEKEQLDIPFNPRFNF